MRRFNNILRVKVPSVVDINAQWRKNKAAPPTDVMSVVSKDVLRLEVKAGNGGHGIARYNGIGGTGGSIFVSPLRNLSFKQFCYNYENSPHLTADSGEPSRQTKLVGRNGSDLHLNVPLGVECVDEGNILLARCSQEKRYLIAKGGQGGCASSNYKGQLGEAVTLFVHLKLRPNVGMIGFPNAGKSTLLKALIPQKRIKIASYPFTTVNPQVCYLKYEDESANVADNEKENNAEGEASTSANSKEKKNGKKFQEDFTLSIADLPGIIEGASKNKGRGYAFLKHLEYSDIIIMIVDVHGFQLTPTLKDQYRTALETIGLLNREMELYNKKLVRKPCILLLNKIDLPNGKEKADELAELFKSSIKNDDDDDDREANFKNTKWVENLPEKMRPRYPLQFEKVLSISAKNCDLGELKSILKQVYQKLHPLEHVIFEEELMERKQKSLM